MIEGVDIAVRYSIFGYLIGEGFRNVFKNKKSTIASLVIMCATMFVFGIFFAVSQNVNHITKTIEEQQGMEVFILDEATAEQKEELKNKKLCKSIMIYRAFLLSCLAESNRRPPPYQGDALPTEPRQHA